MAAAGSAAAAAGPAEGGPILSSGHLLLHGAVALRCCPSTWASILPGGTVAAPQQPFILLLISGPCAACEGGSDVESGPTMPPRNGCGHPLRGAPGWTGWCSITTFAAAWNSLDIHTPILMCTWIPSCTWIKSTGGTSPVTRGPGVKPTHSWTWPGSASCGGWSCTTGGSSSSPSPTR
jgi:hypothetical protein